MQTSNLNKVVSGGYCVGCGACAFVSGTNMNLNPYGEYVPDLDKIQSKENNIIEAAEFVCPSLNPKYNENTLSEHFFNTGNDYRSKYVGNFINIYGGYVKEGQYRNNGTSGGFGTYIGAKLFEKGMIDGVIHVKENKRESLSDVFFKYGLSESMEEILAGARTKYHVIELSEVLEILKNKDGKYLLVGLPCMIKAVRRIQLKNPIIFSKIKYTASLICGHLKSVNWTLSLAWGKGIDPEYATKFKYRTKGEGISARDYFFTAYSDSVEIVEDSSNVVGGKFNQGALMLEACNFCDDVVGETADITIGDAWLPQFEVDSQGTNMLIVRNSEINEMLNECLDSDQVSLVDLTEAQAKDAQSGGFRQRKEGLSYRLKQKDKKKIWRPEKRVQAGEFSLMPLRRLIYFMRHKVSEKSRLHFLRALEFNDYGYYANRLRLNLKILRFFEIASSAPRIIRKKIAYMKLKK